MVSRDGIRRSEGFWIGVQGLLLLSMGLSFPTGFLCFTTGFWLAITQARLHFVCILGVFERFISISAYQQPVCISRRQPVFHQRCFPFLNLTPSASFSFPVTSFASPSLSTIQLLTISLISGFFFSNLFASLTFLT